MNQERGTMAISGKRVKRTRLIQTDGFVVAVEVEMVIPADDPDEPCYEAETVTWLREVRERAERRRCRVAAPPRQGLRGTRGSVTVHGNFDIPSCRSQ